MNIVLSTSRFFPDVYGGVETYTLALAKEFQSLGHSVRVVCTRNAASNQSFINNSDDSYQGIPVRRIVYDPFSRPSRTRQILFDPVTADHVGKALEEWGVEIIHVTNFYGISAAIIPVAKRLGIPIVWTATDFGMTCARHTLLKWDGSLCPGQATFHHCLDCLRPRSGRSIQAYNLLSGLPEKILYPLARLAQKTPFKRIGVFETVEVVSKRLKILLPLLRQIDLIIAPSSWMKEVLVMNDVDPDRIVVSVYGLQQVSPPIPLRTAHIPIQFVFLGRIHSIKGVDILIDAFNQLPNPCGAMLTIYGSPIFEQFEYAGELWSKVKSNPRITIGREIDRGQLPKVLQKIDVLIVPSVWYENSPISILEALSHRIPVIVSDVAGVTDVVQDEINGLLFRRGDVIDLSFQMQRFINDPGLVERFSKQIPVVKNIDQDVQMLLAKYNAILNSRGTS